MQVLLLVIYRISGLTSFTQVYLPWIQRITNSSFRSTVDNDRIESQFSYSHWIRWNYILEYRLNTVKSTQSWITFNANGDIKRLVAVQVKNRVIISFHYFVTTISQQNNTNTKWRGPFSKSAYFRSLKGWLRSQSTMTTEIRAKPNIRTSYWSEYIQPQRGQRDTTYSSLSVYW